MWGGQKNSGQKGDDSSPQWIERQGRCVVDRKTAQVPSGQKDKIGCAERQVCLSLSFTTVSGMMKSVRIKSGWWVEWQCGSFFLRRKVAQWIERQHQGKTTRKTRQLVSRKVFSAGLLLSYLSRLRIVCDTKCKIPTTQAGMKGAEDVSERETLYLF